MLRCPVSEYLSPKASTQLHHTVIAHMLSDITLCPQQLHVAWHMNCLLNTGCCTQTGISSDY